MLNQNIDDIQNQARSDAIDDVIELMRINPPHRIGEAAFMRRLVGLKVKTKDMYRNIYDASCE
jgi:hypothetical protein